MQAPPWRLGTVLLSCVAAGCASPAGHTARTLGPPGPPGGASPASTTATDSAPDAAAIPSDPASDGYVAPPRTIDWASLRFDTRAHASKAWRTIAPTGGDWPELLATAPDDPSLIVALADALLADGNFVCTRYVADVDGCRRPELGVDGPAANAGLDDPCLRRELALWALDELPSDHPSVEQHLTALVSNPQHDPFLVSRAAEFANALPEPMLLRILAKGKSAGHVGVDEGLAGVAEATMRKAAAAHIDGAYEMTAADSLTAMFVTGLRDLRLRAETRAHIAADLGAVLDDNGQMPSNVRAALMRAVSDRSPAVAAAAILALAADREPAALIKRPTRGGARAVAHWLAVLWEVNELSPRALTTPGGIALERSSDSPDAGDEFTAESGPRSRMLLDDELALVFSEEVLAELFDALLRSDGDPVPGLSCSELTCSLERPDVSIRLEVRKRAGAYELVSIHRHERTLAPGDCARPFPRPRDR